MHLPLSIAFSLSQNFNKLCIYLKHLKIFLIIFLGPILLLSAISWSGVGDSSAFILLLSSSFYPAMQTHLLLCALCGAKLCLHTEDLVHLGEPPNPK